MLRRALLKGGFAMPFGTAVGQGFVNPVAVNFAAGNVRINKFGLFVYSGAPAAGNLIFSIASVGGIDRYGNAYVATATNYYPASNFAVSENNGVITYYTAGSYAGPWNQQASVGITAFTTNPDIEISARGGILFNSLTDNLTAHIIPSGDNTGVTDTAAINVACNDYPTVKLFSQNYSLPNPYYINAPIVVPSSTRLTGEFWSAASENDNYSAGILQETGALIIMVPGFTGSAGVLLQNTTNTQQGAVVLEGFTIQGNEIASGTIYGILVDGAWGACFMRGVCVHRPPADCVRFQTDSTSGKIPDDWLIEDCKFSASRNGNGIYMAELADSWVRDTESSQNALDGWYVNYGVQNRWTGCKGENNHANGWHFTGLGQYQVQLLDTCTSHVNQQNGFLFDNAGPSGGGTESTIMLTGCAAQQDGQGSVTSSYAGFKSSGSKARIIGSGCMAQIDSTGAFPSYGAWEGVTSFGMCFTGSKLEGGLAATFDDGSNTHALVNQSPVPF